MLKENLWNFNNELTSILCMDRFLNYLLHSLVSFKGNVSGESLEDFDIDSFELTFRTIHDETLTMTRSFFAFEKDVWALNTYVQLTNEEKENLTQLLFNLKKVYAKIAEEIEGQALWVYERNFFNPFEKREVMEVDFPIDHSLRSDLDILTKAKSDPLLFSFVQKKTNPKFKWTKRFQNELTASKAVFSKEAFDDLQTITIENVTSQTKYDENVGKIETISVHVRYKEEQVTLNFHRSFDFSVPFEVNSECFTEFAFHQFQRLYRYYTNGSSLGYFFDLEDSEEEKCLQDILKILFVDNNTIEDEFASFLSQEEKTNAHDIIGLRIKSVYEQHGDMVYVLENGMELKKANG